MIGFLWCTSVWAAEVVDAALPLVMASSEITAMGGAAQGFASGAAGLSSTPAAPVLRRLRDTRSQSTSFALSYLRAQAEDGRSDLTNAGEAYSDGKSELLVNVGAGGRQDRVGVGLGMTGVQVWGEETMARIADGRFAVAATSPDRQLAAGVAARVMWVELSRDEQQERFMGLGAEAGLSFRPTGSSWQLGVSTRSPVTATAGHSGGFVIDTVQLPWQLSAGGGWSSAAARDRAASGLGVRVGADLVVYGRVDEGVSLAPLLDDVLVERGRSVSYSPRLGGEVEVLPDRLRLRAGSYIEPSRTEGQPPRLHGTGGLEFWVIHLRLLWGLVDHDVSIQSAFDLSERYRRVGWLGVSVWDAGKGTLAPLPE
jgi:hypothetical protein